MTVTALLRASSPLLHLDINDRHPMSLIAQQIELATGVPISYEEAPIENRDDLEDGTFMMDANYRKAHPLEKLFLPVKTHVQAEIHVDSHAPGPRNRRAE